MKKEKSIIKNSLYSSIKTMAAILFPMITYPYVARVLDVDQLGAVNFGNSIISYFLLFGSFGISEYAVRSGARIRNNGGKFKTFCSQMFSLNVVFSIIAYIGLTVIIYNIKYLNNYRFMISILGISILLAPFAIEWFYSIVEDFQYITVRTIAIQALSAVLLFLFVRDKEDIYNYVMLLVIAGGLGNLLNFIHSRKYIRICLIFTKNMFVHVNSLKIFFVNSITSTIYLNSDVTLLGVFCSDYSVGLYSVATKIYSIVKQVFNSIVITIIPRIAFCAANDEEEYYKITKNIFSFIILFSIPSSVGLFLLRKEIVYLIAGEKYVQASTSLGILAFAIVFAVLANISANGILVALGKEKMVVRATMVSALVNVIANFIMIPFFQERGAAITTLMAEICMLLFSGYYLKDTLTLYIDKKNIKDVVLSTFVMIAAFFITDNLSQLITPSMIIQLVVKILISVCTYIAVLFIVRNQVLKSIVILIEEKMKKDIKKTCR